MELKSRGFNDSYLNFEKDLIKEKKVKARKKVLKNRSFAGFKTVSKIKKSKRIPLKNIAGSLFFNNGGL